ncbi:MAG TPA: metalloregulator ArsR/SmtB family transcription factor [Candidatus Deferrimicrobiaceae bacterium]
MPRKQPDVCETSFVDETHVERARKALSSERDVMAMAETFRTLGDSTRVKVVQALSAEELCVCDIARLLGISESATSHQLRVLRSQKLVKYRKEGKMAYYTLDDEHIDALMKEALQHVLEDHRGGK